MDYLKNDARYQAAQRGSNGHKATNDNIDSLERFHSKCDSAVKWTAIVILIVACVAIKLLL